MTNYAQIMTLLEQGNKPRYSNLLRKLRREYCECFYYISLVLILFSLFIISAKMTIKENEIGI